MLISKIRTSISNLFNVDNDLDIEIQKKITERLQFGALSSVLVLSAILVLLLILWIISPKGHTSTHAFSTIPTVFAIYSPLLAFRIWQSLKSEVQVIWASVYTVLDVVLILSIIWLYHIEYVKPLSFSLRAPSFQFLLLIIALRCLTLRPGLVLLATLTAAFGWAVILYFAVISPDVEITRSYIEYTSSGKILVGAEVEKIISLLITGFVLTASVFATKKLLKDSVMSAAQTENLSRFFSPQIAELIRAGKLKFKAGHGVQRNASILFVDLRGFTTLSQKMDSNDIMSLLTEYQDRIVPIILKNNGAIDKFMGDGILIHFGAVIENETHSADCLRAIEEIIVESKKWNDHRIKKGQEPIEINVAASTGTIVFGSTGNAKRLEMTVIGYPVNTAAKLEKVNKELNSLATMTNQLVALAKAQGFLPSVIFDFVPQHKIHGNPEPLDLYVVSKNKS